MSYILDALKKAQADESADGRAALALELKESSRRRRWQHLVFAALLLNAGVLVTLFGPWSVSDESGALPATTATAPEDAARAPASTATGAPAPGAALEPDEVTQAAATAAAGTAQAAGTASLSVPAAPPAPGVPPRPSRTQPQATRASAGAATPLERVSLAALPASARARFPAVDFSTHLYASDAELRAVVMNGQRLQEGERYGELELEEITETGVVLRFEGYLVSVPVLDDWQQ